MKQFFFSFETVFVVFSPYDEWHKQDVFIAAFSFPVSPSQSHTHFKAIDSKIQQFTNQSLELKSYLTAVVIMLTVKMSVLRINFSVLNQKEHKSCFHTN